MNIMSRGLWATVLIVTAGIAAIVVNVGSAGPALAQEGIDPAAVITVPYRLPTASGEEVEMRLQFRNRYKEVLGATFDITVPKPDGDSTLELAAADGRKIILTLNVKGNTVLSTRVDTDARPAAGASSLVLAVSSRSGEALYFLFQFSGSSVIGVTYNSSRTGFTK
jgi:hypothetical protein